MLKHWKCSHYTFNAPLKITFITECLQQYRGSPGPYKKVRMIYKKYKYHEEQAKFLSFVNISIYL